MDAEQEVVSGNAAAYLFFPNNPHPAVDITVMPNFSRQTIWGSLGYTKLSNVEFIDSRTAEKVDVNQITLAKGEELLIRCPQWNIASCDNNAYKVAWDSYDSLGSLFSNTVLYKKNAAWWYGSDSFGWEIWSDVSNHGPWFLFSAKKVGATSFNIYFGSWFYHSNDQDGSQQLKQGDLIGHVTVTVVP